MSLYIIHIIKKKNLKHFDSICEFKATKIFPKKEARKTFKRGNTKPSRFGILADTQKNSRIVQKAKIKKQKTFSRNVTNRPLIELF